MDIDRTNQALEDMLSETEKGDTDDEHSILPTPSPFVVGDDMEIDTWSKSPWDDVVAEPSEPPAPPAPKRRRLTKKQRPPIAHGGGGV